jgi:hypothetical protein
MSSGLFKDDCRPLKIKFHACLSEAHAQFAIRFSPKIQRFYQRKVSKNHMMVARKSVAHKLARACFYVMRDLTPFDVDRAFG